MLKKLYLEGCFNYQKFIIDNAKELSLTSNEIIILTTMLNKNLVEYEFSYSELANQLFISRDELELALSRLAERGFYREYVTTINEKLTEMVSLEGFFSKALLILDKKDTDTETELKSVVSAITEAIGRTLSPTELETVVGLVNNENVTLKDIKRAIEIINIKNMTMTIKSIIKVLSSEATKPEKSGSSIALEIMSKIR